MFSTLTRPQKKILHGGALNIVALGAFCFFFSQNLQNDLVYHGRYMSEAVGSRARPATIPYDDFGSGILIFVLYSSRALPSPNSTSSHFLSFPTSLFLLFPSRNLPKPRSAHARKLASWHRPRHPPIPVLCTPSPISADRDVPRSTTCHQVLQIGSIYSVSKSRMLMCK